MTNTSVKWAAELAHVREVSLLGTADLAFWKDRLLKEGLPKAQVIYSSRPPKDLPTQF